MLPTSPQEPMFGPLTLIPRDPLIALVLVVAFLSGLVLHNLVQARLARRLGDAAAAESGFASPEPLHHFSFPSVVWYLLLGLGLPRPLPLRLTGRRAAAVLLAGPLTLVLWAFALMSARQALLPVAPWADVAFQGLQFAAVASLLHAVFFLLPFPTLDGGRALFQVGSAGVRQALGQLAAAGPVALYILWLALWLSGAANWVVSPLWSAMQKVLSWWPF